MEWDKSQNTCLAVNFYWEPDESKPYLCFEFISHAILSILYPYSCKTHNISSKFGFFGFFMKASDLVRKDAKCFRKES